MKHALINGRVVTPYRVIPLGGVVMEDGRILTVFEGDCRGTAETVTDVDGCYISPGFIDLHTHGGGGHDYMDGTAEAFIGAAKTHMRYGTTALLPTTMTCADEELWRAFACYREAKANMRGGPHLLGLHLEGPYFDQTRHGAQDTRYLKLPEPEHTHKVLEHADSIARISLAPELPGAMALAGALRERGIMASIGHSNARYDEVLEACENGFSLVTHFYSGNTMLSRIDARRVLGIVETAYLIDELAVEIICDGIHLPPELLRLILRQKPHDKICLITDSMRGAGLPEGQTVKLGSLANGQDAILEGGVAWMPHRRSYAGSVCTMDRCVRTLVRSVGVPVEDAVRMASLSPARAIRRYSKGVLAPGMDADICVFDEDIHIQSVYVAGVQTWNRKQKA